MNFEKILKKYREESFSERGKGRSFERLIREYLLTDPEFTSKLDKVWMWEDFFAKAQLGGTDTGIDLVAKTYDGEFWAIQCKFVQESTHVDKPAVDSFLATSSKQFKNEELKTIKFAHRLWISTTNNWGRNAEEAINNQDPPVTRISLYQLSEAPVDWTKLDKEIHGTEARVPKKSLMAHQIDAVDSAHEHLRKNDRGQLIMACGTGKTYVSLKIAEKETKGKGLILFLVPSIALLSQALREWSAEAAEELNAICICSDPKVSTKKKDIDSMSVVDLALPASTDVSNIIRQFKHIEKHPNKGLTVVFSTYQSIDVISKVQKKLAKENSKYSVFDLIICDEAHRTTGVELSKEEASAFTKVHKQEFLNSKKRIYMTATPRLYSDDSKSKAAEIGAELCSMDDKNLYGEEFYRIGFGEAVDKKLLTDYKVLILTLTDQDVSPGIQKMIANSESEITSDDATKLVGCINALSKQILGDEGILDSTDPEPMRKAIAFCQTIAVSKKITNTFNDASDPYLSALPAEKREQMVNISAKHIDGTMSAPTRDELMSWLKNEGEGNECHILTNVRCLSEGVDVPSLDAVLFLSPRNSQVDVVQSVGRVMRKSPGKKYGYIVIPVVIPSDIDPNKALDDNKRYKVVWTVLNALRAHDDRFNAIINKIELNKKKPPQILIGRPGYTFENGEPVPLEGKDRVSDERVKQLTLQFEELQGKIFAKMVQKVGEKKYWEQWAKDVAIIAERQTERINRLIKENPKYQKAFSKYIIGLKKNINPSITEQEAVEMLSQHIITKPVFEALFDGYSFVKNNPISVSMQNMLDLLESQNLEKDTETLNKFYESVKKSASGIDNTEGKQRVIIELYDKFFKTAFPKMVEKLGIVYTPVEVVDFIIHSIEDVLQKEFNHSLGDKNIQILDPFTGTGTFITRLIQSGLITRKDLEYKYKNEIYANEIVLLAYYIAAVNIENAYHDAMNEDKYHSFEGICLTDTFQLGEDEGKDKLFSEMFPQNLDRVEKQKKAPLRIIMGNPPYSIGQKSANDNAQNQSYEKLDSRVAETYASASGAVLQKALYDAYIKAFRWSTDRLDPQNGGIIAFVSNGAWLDGNSTAGFRKSIEKEFSSIYVFNLRGNARTSGELRRKEAGCIFADGSRTPIAITLLVKNPNQKNKKAKIHYYDIGDYLSRKEKLDIISSFKSVDSTKMKWETIKPNEHGDWLNQRNDIYSNLIPLSPERKYLTSSKSFFIITTLGAVTSRDSWVYSFSEKTIRINIKKTIEYYNKQRKECHSKKKLEPYRNSKEGSWSRDWMRFLKNNHEISEIDSEYRVALYRPFVKEAYYFDDDLNQERYQLYKIFPTILHENVLICCSGMGGNKKFSAIISDNIVDYNLLEAGAQCFPLFFYEENSENKPSLFNENSEYKYRRKDSISDFILQRAHGLYGKDIKKEDIFYYIYGILHSEDYRTIFSNDLKKSSPRIPLVNDVKDFWNFSKAGRKLAELHLSYEDAPPFNKLKIIGRDSGVFIVDKMKFADKNKKDTIIYNSKITISNIPDEAYKYIVNGKSAIEWIMDRYQIRKDPKSNIINDPNDWSKEHNKPSYILDLLSSVINVSVQTVEIVENLPKLDFSE